VRLNPPHRVLTYLLDSRQGLIIYAPIFFLTVLLFSRLDRTLVLTVLTYFLLMSVWRGYPGEFAPSRYVACVAPFLLSGLAFRKKETLFTYFLWLCSFAVAGWGFVSFRFLESEGLHAVPWALDSAKPLLPFNALVLLFWGLAAFLALRRSSCGTEG